VSGDERARTRYGIDCFQSSGCEDIRSRAVLSELFANASREPLQTEVSAVRVLSKLFGFLLIADLTAHFSPEQNQNQF
jgi:hypothetical protein